MAKHEVVAAVAPKLLPALFQRPKTGFTVPVHEWIRGGAVVGERGLRGWARQVHANFAKWRP